LYFISTKTTSLKKATSVRKIEKPHFQNFIIGLSIQPLINVHSKSQWQHCLLVDLPSPQMSGLVDFTRMRGFYLEDV